MKKRSYRKLANLDSVDKKDSTIYETRHGFLYQDRFAVFKYLQHTLKYLAGTDGRRIRKFYIDFPLKSAKSLDIRIEFEDQLIEIYEVKAGELAKNNLSKMTGYITGFWNLYKHEKDCIPYFVVRHTSPGDKVRQLMMNVELLQKNSNNKKICNLSRSLKLSVEEVMIMLQKIVITDYPGDERDCNRRQNSIPIDKQIVSLINQLAQEIKIQNYNEIITPEFLMNDLCHSAVLYAGTEKNLHEIFLEQIADFFCKREVIDSIHRNKIGLSSDEAICIKNKIKNKLNTFSKLQEVTDAMFRDGGELK